MTYRNIIFDAGNVLVTLDEGASMKAFQALGLGKADHVREHPELLKMFQAMGLGQITNQTFFDGFRRLVNPYATDRQIADATNAMMVEIPEVKKRKLLQLRDEGYHTYLLSNTIDLHWQYCVDVLFRMGQYTVDDYFDSVFVSQEMGIKKPSDEIFQAVIREADIRPEDTLFIDDLEVNCEAAERNGIHAFQNKRLDDWLALF
ncbi:MAG: HAD family phosphatase [Prevotella sp.]|nr:HAD family phosphatase [Prevotella sp.]